jgi:hypothetical protein
MYAVYYSGFKNDGATFTVIPCPFHKPAPTVPTAAATAATTQNSN